MIIRRRSHFGWGPSDADFAMPQRGIVLHFNGRATHLSAHAECIAYWKRVRSFHVDGNGWVDIGYSFGVCPHGEVFTGRGLYRYQAAQGTTEGNREYYSITLMVGGTEVPPAQQIDMVRDFRRYLIGLGAGVEIRPHQEFFDTDCPGPVITELLSQGAFDHGTALGLDLA
ncbi:peptidoglycan recognition protein family protein [Streptomyces sp. NPDC001966]